MLQKSVATRISPGLNELVLPEELARFATQLGDPPPALTKSEAFVSRGTNFSERNATLFVRLPSVKNILSLNKTQGWLGRPLRRQNGGVQATERNTQRKLVQMFRNLV